MASNTPPPLALQWNRLVCQAINDHELPPTLAARTLAMVHTAMYDAWSAYAGGRFFSTVTAGRLKRPEPEQTPENRQIAFSFAARRVLEHLLGSLSPECKQKIAHIFASFGCSVDDPTTDLTMPAGIGCLSADLLIAYRQGDGSNERHDYDDYTKFKPVNAAPPETPTKVGKWQPQCDERRDVQSFLHPHWGLVRPFALEWGGQYRPPAPPHVCPRPFAPADKLIHLSACLTEEQKLSAEYWAGMHEDQPKPDSNPNRTKHWITPPVLCCRMAQSVAEHLAYANGNIIKLFFAVTNGLLDTSIAAWEAKVFYDYARPVSVIRELYDDAEIQAWGGPCRGKVTMEGEGWSPYLLTTPPFAEFPSGHSAFTRATADLIQCFSGTDEYPLCVKIPRHGSVIEPKCTPSAEVTLRWNTLQEAADQAGLSRRYGGIHFEAGDLCGRELGNKVASCVWRKVCGYFDGNPC